MIAQLAPQASVCICCDIQACVSVSVPMVISLCLCLSLTRSVCVCQTQERGGAWLGGVSKKEHARVREELDVVTADLRAKIIENGAGVHTHQDRD
jgi:hypothetical protein